METGRPLDHSLCPTTLLTSEGYYTLFFGFNFSQTAFFAQTALYFSRFDVIILKLVFIRNRIKTTITHVISFWFEFVLQVPICEFVERQVLPPALADGEEKSAVGRNDLLINISSASLICHPRPGRCYTAAEMRNINVI